MVGCENGINEWVIFDRAKEYQKFLEIKKYLSPFSLLFSARVFIHNFSLFCR